MREGGGELGGERERERESRHESILYTRNELASLAHSF